MKTKFETKYGQLFQGDSIKLIEDKLLPDYKEKINLILTSPPFPLNNKKAYGNLQGDAYKDWFISLAPLFSKLLAKDGSLVIEIGNAWESKRPIQSLLHLECLLGFLKDEKSEFRLCQEFISYNPSKLPSPAQWVTVNRIRTVDSYTHVWWMSKTDYPKADNSKILKPYSESMKRLLQKQSYNSGKRPSEHFISVNGFLKDQKGSIMHNFLEWEQLDPKRDFRLPENVVSFSNTISNDHFLNKCRDNKIIPHPARMNTKLASFFIQFLTDHGDLVFDPFAGSNTTGYCAEILKRKWLSVEINKDYIKQAKIRFNDPKLKIKTNHTILSL